MKRLMTDFLFAAAALAALAAAAHAQVLTADIPFAFHAGGKGMSAGTYQIAMEPGSSMRIMRVQNVDTHAAVMLSNFVGRDPSKAWRAAGTPKISFECAATRCALREVWTGSETSLRINGPKPGPEDAVQVTEIRMTRAPAM